MSATENLQAQVEAVMNVLAPYVDGPPGYTPQRWPIFRLEYEGVGAVMPSDEQVRAMAEQIVTAIRTASMAESICQGYPEHDWQRGIEGDPPRPWPARRCRRCGVKEGES